MLRTVYLLTLSGPFHFQLSILQVLDLSICHKEILHSEYIYPTITCNNRRVPQVFLCLLVFGAGMDNIPEILSGLNFLYPFPIIWPRYITSGSTNFNLFLDTFKPFAPKKFRSCILVVLTLLFSSPDINRSPTYCRICTSISGVNCSSSVSSACPKRFGDLLNPWGRRVHLSCCFLFLSGCSHSNANQFLHSSAKEHAQNASLRSIIVNQACSFGIWLKSV